MKDNQDQGRRSLVEYLKAELIGPADGRNEKIEGDSPTNRYIMGVLFPAAQSMDLALEAEEVESSTGQLDPDITDDPVTLAGQWMPAALGMTFFFSGASTIEVCLQAAGYRNEKSEDGSADVWYREPLADTTLSSADWIGMDAPSSSRLLKLNVLGKRALLSSYWRKRGDGWIVTVTLMNALTRNENSYPEAQDCLFQAGFVCRVPSGHIRRYPQADKSLQSAEEEELEVLYRDVPIYGIGHGCAAAWQTRADGVVETVYTELMPMQEVAAMTYEIPGDADVLSVSWLANTQLPVKELCTGLRKFVESYQLWITNLRGTHIDIPRNLSKARDRIIDRLNEAARRMATGINLLEQDPLVRRAFNLANLSMLMQMYHGSDLLGGGRHQRNSKPYQTPDYMSGIAPRWRPFQLAFQLLTLESTANVESPDREIVDLIWFPTGGGKTEAYLAVAAFEIFLRRLRHRDRGAGTAVITRYTLRLLTAQQFQRTARLICACEILRRQYESEMGSERISAGLWVGSSASPNTVQEAKEKLDTLLEEAEPKNPFQLEVCPWCGTELVPSVQKEDEGYYGFRATNQNFEVYCPSKDCPFHEQIPVAIVDDILYKNPPTFLIGTVDKFARLAWVSEAGNFFGSERYLPPSLIIQDELHLLSGPLGTIAGLYERAIAGLIELRGSHPKIIASTATIRSAGTQVQGLFGRDVRQFPPPGLTSQDSYFARADSTKPGRLYLGIMSTSHRPTTSLIRLCAGLQQGVYELNLDGSLTDWETDGYWSLVVYHNSLRELGKTVTFARDDIPARMKVIARDESKMRVLDGNQVLELTSNLSAEEIPQSLSRINYSWTDPRSVSLLASSNMISVGVDFPRLGLMVINGQPKTTSEYIQSSSRVGRGRVPGLVVTHYSSNKPRDRSHYESFLPYHAALYRHVEPTSVTPFSVPARERALHAALVILIRHGGGISDNASANSFRSNDILVQRSIDILVRSVERADPEEVEHTRKHIQRLVEEWKRKALNNMSPLYYQATSRQHVALLKNFGESKDGWSTLNSMRNVDSECNIALLGEPRNG